MILVIKKQSIRQTSYLCKLVRHIRLYYIIFLYAKVFKGQYTFILQRKIIGQYRMYRRFIVISKGVR